MAKNIELSFEIDGKKEIFGNGIIHEKGEIELVSIIGGVRDFLSLGLNNPIDLTAVYQIMQRRMDSYKGKPRIKINIY
ncbi:MAG: hypothetical protein AABW47_04515 [Nanoarchaeota archaeon]